LEIIMMRSVPTCLALFCLIALTCPAMAELGAEDVRLPGQLNSGLLFATTSGDLINCRNVNDMIEFNRSTDNGKTWSYWSNLGDDGNPNTAWILSDIHHVDATVERVFVSLRYQVSSGGTVTTDMVILAKTDPNGSAPFWTTSVIDSATASSFVTPFSLSSDAENYADYNIYCAYTRIDADGNDIWYSRSTDKGSSFETPYKVAGTSSSDRHFKLPAIDYGYAGFVHLAWISDNHVETESSVMYMYASGRGSSALNWVAPQYLTSHTDGLMDWDLSLAASRNDGSVVVCYEKNDSPDPGDITGNQTEILHSTNYGGSFSGPDVYPEMLYPRLVRGPNGYVIGVNNYVNNRSGLMRPSPAGLGNPWQYEDMLASRSQYGVDVAFNPAKGNRWAMVGSFRVPGSIITSPAYPWFDAEWFQDPGYPVLVGALPNGNSDVCLADLDGDGSEEIIYTDFEGFLRVFGGDLQEKPGFPIDLDVSSGSPPDYTTGYIAAGDLDNDGDLEIIVGTIGKIFGFDHLGQPLPGWPVDMGTGYRYKVSLGTVSRSAPLDIVATTSNRTHLFRIDGSQRAGSPIIHDFATLGTHQHAAALGDVDNDGDMEMVLSLTHSVVVLGPTGSLEGVPWSDPAVTLYNPLRLADMDLDGDLELAFSVGSTVQVRHHTGASLGRTWPWTEPGGRTVSPLAIAHHWSTSNPELLFGTTGIGEQFAYMVAEDGTIPTGWPHSLGNDDQMRTPLIDQFSGFPSGVLFLTAAGQAHAFRNFLTGIEGWPHAIPASYDDGATGDIDNDGLLEIVAAGSMQIYKTNGGTTANGQNKWPMSRFDSERTSCAGCIVDRVSSAPDESVTFTRISFRGGYPNPFKSQTSLQYELPANGTVKLAIYDIRGHRVREILRTEQAAGNHALVWDRTDDHGRPVAGGTYLARLTARGPGMNEVLTRKITVLK
jgi:hypothetical protein